jgi:hypothetical protein
MFLLESIWFFKHRYNTANWKHNHCKRWSTRFPTTNLQAVQTQEEILPLLQNNLVSVILLTVQTGNSNCIPEANEGQPSVDVTLGDNESTIKLN